MNKKMAEVLSRDPEELVSSLERAREELFKLKLGRSTQQLTNVMQIRGKRREIARILTAQAQKKAPKAEKIAKPAKTETKQAAATATEPAAKKASAKKPTAAKKTAPAKKAKE